MNPPAVTQWGFRQKPLYNILTPSTPKVYKNEFPPLFHVSCNIHDCPPPLLDIHIQAFYDW